QRDYSVYDQALKEFKEGKGTMAEAHQKIIDDIARQRGMANGQEYREYYRQLAEKDYERLASPAARDAAGLGGKATKETIPAPKTGGRVEEAPAHLTDMAKRASGEAADPGRVRYDSRIAAE